MINSTDPAWLLWLKLIGEILSLMGMSMCMFFIFYYMYNDDLIRTIGWGTLLMAGMMLRK